MVIGVAGYKNAGKDTVADWFVTNHGYTKIGFSDPVKDIFCELTGLNRIELELLKNDPTAHLGVGYINNPSEAPEGVDVSFAEKPDGSVRMWSPIVDPITIRHALQKIGTEIGRDMLDEDLWIKFLDERITILAKNFVISDVRFENECNYIHDCDGLVLRVSRPKSAADEHVSESGLNDDFVDFDLYNDGSIADLHNQLQELVESWETA